MTQLVLLDRDGTINVERHYLSSPDELELLPGSAEGIRLLKDLGLVTAVVTNQSGIGRGYFTLGTLDRIHQRLIESLASRGAWIDALYVCPHRPDEGCYCRKPAPGLARKAAAEFQADLARSFVVGDNVCDIELGKQVGATTLLVRTGHGAHVALTGNAQPDYVVADLGEAARQIERLMISHNGDSS